MSSTEPLLVGYIVYLFTSTPSIIIIYKLLLKPYPKFMQPENIVKYKAVGKYYYNITIPLGRGCYGTVFQAFDIVNKSQVFAVKVIPFVALVNKPAIEDLITREIHVLKNLVGPHVVRLVDVSRSSRSLYIFMDFCDGGDLQTKLKKEGPLGEEEGLRITKQIASAFITIEEVKIIHNGKKVAIMHRDIKPANIMFHKGIVKLTDFGFAKMVDDLNKNNQEKHTTLGTPLYSPPQILNCENYSAKCDVWSTGVVLYEMIFGSKPWGARVQGQLYDNIKKNPLVLPRKVRKETEDLIRGMLRFDEKDRLTWREVYDHPALSILKK